MNEISAECIRLGALSFTHTHSWIRFAGTCEPHMFLVRHGQRHLQNVHMECSCWNHEECNMQPEKCSHCSLRTFFLPFLSIFSVFLLIEFSLAFSILFSLQLPLDFQMRNEGLRSKSCGPNLHGASLLFSPLLSSSLFSLPRFLLHIFHCIPRLIDNN